MEDSDKAIIRHGKKRGSHKSGGKEGAFEACRNFQEVKICIANFENGMTERKVVLTSLYPTADPPSYPSSKSMLSNSSVLPRSVFRHESEDVNLDT